MTPTCCRDSVEEGRDPREEVAELDALLERLRLKRYALKRKINQLHSPIVRKLPPDVTSTIFEFCLQDFADHPLFPYRDTEEDLSIPLSLGAICSYWRDIAWSSPRLWSSLVVRVTRKHDSDITTGIAQEWLARSGQLPLTIRIYSESYNTTFTELADIINQYSTRWFKLDLYIPDRDYQRFQATDNHAPILTSIQFYCSAHTVPKMKMNFQLTCPRLERASFSSFFPMEGTNIQWDNLTHLTLHFISIIDSFPILRKTSRLIFFKVSGFCPPYREQSIGAPVLTSLRSLQLLISNIAADDFLQNLIAPHLEEFNLARYYISSFEAITSFLRRSACSLRSFSLFFSTLPEVEYFEGLISLLQSMPSLNSLSLLSITNPDNTAVDYNPRNILQLVAKVLSSQSTSLQQGFLPNLKILEYTGKLYLPPGNYDELYSLPLADNAVHVPFRSLNLDIHPATRIPKSMISYLSSLVERGITVNVLNNSKDILQSSIDYYRCTGRKYCRIRVRDHAMIQMKTSCL